MNTSRRHAIRLGISATASLVVALPGFCQTLAAQSAPHSVTPGDDNGWLRRELFEGAVGQAFRVRTTPSAITLRLVRVDDPAASRNSTPGDANHFVVVFRGPRQARLAQGTYQIDSRTMGTFELFLVPGWTTGSGTTYTATFNRLA